MVWTPYTNAHPPVIAAKMTVNITNAVMPAMPATTLDPHLTCNKVNLVIEDKDLLRRNLEKAGDLADWSA